MSSWPARDRITRVRGVPTKEAYDRSEALRMLELSERRLRSWERQGLVPRLSEYAFPDLVVLRTLVRLSESGVSPLKIRRAVTALREKLGSATDPLKELTILSDGGRIVVQLGASRMEPVSGQLLLDFDKAELRRMLAFPRQPKTSAAKAAEQERRGRALVWFEKALELERCAAPIAEVIRTYEQALELDPVSAGVLVNLGTIYFHMRDWDKAERHYRRALEADPQYALAHFNLGNLFDEKGDRSQALLQYLMALRLDPNYRDAHYNLALLCQASGQLMRAVRHWKAYLKLDTTSPWAVIARQELDRLRRATVIQGAGRAEVKAGA
jgi:tetratricopeptide (TPR) repeat protein